jgi:hypothetical protein
MIEPMKVVKTKIHIHVESGRVQFHKLVILDMGIPFQKIAYLLIRKAGVRWNDKPNFNAFPKDVIQAISGPGEKEQFLFKQPL